MRQLLPFLFLVATCATPLAAATTAEQEVAFGIEVAERGLWKEARFRFQRAVELDPANASALNNLGIALEQQGEFDGAREAYEKAIELKPEDLYIQQNYDLFREADDKRNRKNNRRARRP